jgi:TP901 family phage tail tape measure protein
MAKSHISTLTVRLKDDVSKPAMTVAEALKAAERRVKDVAKAMSNTGATDKFQKSLAGLKLSAKDISTVSDAWKAYARSANLAGDATKWTRAQAAGVKAWERQTIAALRGVMREQDRFRKAVAAAPLGDVGALSRKAMGMVGGLGLAGGAGAFVKRGAEDSLSLERALYDVSRATDAAGADLDAYKKKLASMSLSTGAKTTELAQMLAAAGFAGRPKAELLDFTTYANKAMTAWGLNAEETGQALAEIGNIYQANQGRIGEIGDAINTAADQSAAKESDLLEVLRRVGASGNQIGVTAEQTLAFAAALKEVGTQPQVIGTALQALFTNLALGDDATKEFSEGLKEIKTNSKQLQKDVRKNATGAIVDLLEKIEKVPDGLKRMEILKKLFGREYADNIGAMLNNLKGVKRLLDVMGDKKNYLGSVDRDAQKKLQTDFNRLERAQRALEQFGRNIGDPLKIAAGSIAAGVNSIFEASQKATEAADALNAATKRIATGNATPDDVDLLSKTPGGAGLITKAVREAVTSTNAADAAATDAAIAAGGDAEALDIASRRRNMLREISALEAQIATAGGSGVANQRIRLGQIRNTLAGLPPDAPAGRIPADYYDRHTAAREEAAKRIAEEADKSTGLKRLIDLRAGLSIGSPARLAIDDAITAATRGEGGFSRGFAPGEGWRPGQPANVPVPPNRPGGSPVRPQVNADGIDAAGKKADEAKEKIDALGASVRPTVDVSSIAAAEQMVDRLANKLTALGSTIQATSAKIGSLSSMQRGNFRFGGVQGE